MGQALKSSLLSSIPKSTLSGHDEIVGVHPIFPMSTLFASEVYPAPRLSKLSLCPRSRSVQLEAWLSSAKHRACAPKFHLPGKSTARCFNRWHRPQNFSSILCSWRNTENIQKGTSALQKKIFSPKETIGNFSSTMNTKKSFSPHTSTQLAKDLTFLLFGHAWAAALCFLNSLLCRRRCQSCPIEKSSSLPGPCWKHQLKWLECWTRHPWNWCAWSHWE